MCFYFLVCIICSLKPFHSGLLGASIWYSSPVTSYLIHPQVFKSPYPSVQTLLICSMILNDTARKYLPQGALRGFGKYCPPATTLGPEPSTAFWPPTRTCFRKGYSSRRWNREEGKQRFTETEGETGGMEGMTAEQEKGPDRAKREGRGEAEKIRQKRQNQTRGGPRRH